MRSKERFGERGKKRGRWSKRSESSDVREGNVRGREMESQWERKCV